MGVHELILFIVVLVMVLAIISVGSVYLGLKGAIHIFFIIGGDMLLLYLLYFMGYYFYQRRKTPEEAE